MQKILNNEQNIIDLLECNEYFYLDSWHFYSTDLLREYCYKCGYYCKKRQLDFSSINSYGIKNELKYWLISLINQGKGNSILMHRYPELLALISFFSQSIFNSVNSILSKDFEHSINRYKIYINSIGKPITKNGRRIDKKLEYSYYQVDSTYISVYKIFYNFINNHFMESPKNIFDRDIWMYVEMPFQMNMPPSSINKGISFKKIQQPWLKYLTKKLCWYYFEFTNMGTGQNYCYNITTFSKFLSKFHPELPTEKDLTGDMIKEYYEYIKTSFKGATKTKGSKVQAVENLLAMTKKFNWSVLDESCYFVKKPQFIYPSTSVNPYSDEELVAINNQLSKLPKQIARLICVAQYLGCRPSEICSFEINNYITSNDGSKYIYYRQFKTKKFNIVPLNDICCELISAAIETTRSFHGDKAKYIFSLEDREIISPDTVLYRLKIMSKNNQLEDKNGRPLNIILKRFRAVVATQYADLGINPQAIMRMLGQSSLGILSSYIDINNETYLNALAPVLEEQGQMIRNIGKKHVAITDKPAEEDLIPLPNGSCGKPIEEGVCKHANTCYQCMLFVPKHRYLNEYRYQMSRARQNMIISKEHGCDRLQQMNESLFESLCKIISKLEGENEQFENIGDEREKCC